MYSIVKSEFKKNNILYLQEDRTIYNVCKIRKHEFIDLVYLYNNI